MVLAESEIFDGTFLTAIFVLMRIGYPCREKMLWARYDLVCL